MNILTDSWVIRTGWNFRAIQSQSFGFTVEGNEEQRD